MDIDTKVYVQAKQFLINELEKRGYAESELDKYLISHKKSSLNEIYFSLLSSSINRGLFLNAISSPLDGTIEPLGDILYSFDHLKVFKKYQNKKEELLNKIVNEFDLDVNQNKKGVWPQFTNSIISGAEFLIQFKDFSDFDNFVEFFHKDERARKGLPMLIKEQVDGIGFALACDFLKEAGYIRFGKPDTWLKQILLKTKLSDYEDDYRILKVIERVAKSNNVSEYNVDKIFWLIGSGKFYKTYDAKGKILRIGRKLNTFLKETT